MKGVELPINILVIVAVAIIVLLGLIAMYFTGFGPFATATSLEGVKNEACRKLVQENRCKGYSYEIDILDFDANKNGNNDPGTSWDWSSGTGDDNLAALCYNYYSVRSESGCKQLCQCAGMEKYTISPAELHAMGDINWDCVIDNDDFWFFSGANPNSCYLSTPGKPNWNPDCDFDNDGDVDFNDFTTIIGNLGKTCL